MIEAYKRAVELGEHGLIEEFAIIQWKNGKHIGETICYEFPGEDFIRDLAADCAYVTIEKRYAALPFA